MRLEKERRDLITLEGSMSRDQQYISQFQKQEIPAPETAVRSKLRPLSYTQELGSNQIPHYDMIKGSPIMNSAHMYHSSRGIQNMSRYSDIESRVKQTERSFNNMSINSNKREQYYDMSNEMSKNPAFPYQMNPHPRVLERDQMSRSKMNPRMLPGMHNPHPDMGGKLDNDKINARAKFNEEALEIIKQSKSSGIFEADVYIK